MSCKGCGDKTVSRYGEVINQAPPPPGGPQDPLGSGKPGDPIDPFSSFYAARGLSYEELTTRREMSQRMLRQAAEEMLVHMSEPMKQVHIDELISVVNCETDTVPGMTPNQALVALNRLIDRDSWQEAFSYYPGLKEEVKKRYQELTANRLPTRKAE